MAASMLKNWMISVAKFGAILCLPNDHVYGQTEFLLLLFLPPVIARGNLKRLLIKKNNLSACHTGRSTSDRVFCIEEARGAPDLHD